MTKTPPEPRGEMSDIRPFLSAVATWAERQPGVGAVVLVGSHARGSARPDSDVDLVLLLDDPQAFLADTHWLRSFGQPERQEVEHWGKVASLRVWYADGREVEYGLAGLDWGSDPADEGDMRVIRDGIRIVYQRGAQAEQLLGGSPETHEAVFQGPRRGGRLETMLPERAMPIEETLDPEDWESMRALGHRILDDILDHLEAIRGGPVWQHAPEAVKTHFDGPPPLDPQPPDAVYEEYRRYVLPYLLGNTHPRFWGWIAGTGTVMGAFAELLATATNSVSGAFSFMSSNYVERQVIDWFKAMLGYPASASGQLTSGCSASNLIGLAVARNTQAGYDLRREGLRAAPREMALYASQESHSSIQKAVELLGLGSDSLRQVPVNDDLQIDLPALKAAIKRDRQHGHYPFCVVGVAGTTNTGAIDDLNALADICQEEGLWFHVDGAFGAWAAIAPESKHLVAGMERADSLAFDLHKWMYLPYAIGCVLVRREEDQRRTFSLTPTYLAHGEGDRGLTAVDVPWLVDYGYQLSRAFPALKAWMTIKEHGLRKYARLIQQNIDQAHYLAGLVEAAPQLELALPVSLNVVCFRYNRAGLDGVALDKLNKQIEIELQEQGIAVPSIVTIKGKKYLHAAITNHRSRREDFDILVREVIRIGDELV